MTDEPIRWSDDPSSEAEFGGRIDEVRTLHRGYDLEGIRARAFVTPPPVAPPSPLRWWLLGGGGGGLVVLAVALLAWSVGAPQGVTEPAPPIVAPAPARVVVTPPVAAPAPTSEPVSPAPIPPTRVRAPLPAPPVAPPVEAPVLLPDPPTEVAIADAPAPEPEAPSAASLLALQNEQFAGAMELLAGGLPAEALVAFDGFVATWPDAELADEAQLARLECFVTLARWDDAEQLAGALAARPALSSRRGYLHRLRSESLAELGRCPEALAAAAFVSKQQVAIVRRSCTE